MCRARYSRFGKRLVLFCCSNIFIAKAFSSEPSFCKAIAYVINSKDRTYTLGQKLCAGQDIPLNSSIASANVTIACIYYKNRQYLVKDYRQIKNCETNLVFPGLFPDKPSKTNRARGDLSDSLVLLSPSGKYLINQSTLKFVWLPVKYADKYIVEVIINGEESKKYITRKNEISMPILGKGEVNYIISVYSTVGQLDSNIYSYNIEPKNMSQFVDKYLKRIDDFAVDDSTKISLKISVLTEYNMPETAINILSIYLSTHDQDYKSYLMMGDAQLLTGNLYQAQINYDKSKMIAINNRDKNFIENVDSRLNLIKVKS